MLFNFINKLRLTEHRMPVHRQALHRYRQLMKKVILFIAIMFGLGARAQTAADTLPPPPPVAADYSCIYQQKYTASARNSFYPFNSAAKVKLVSFRYHYNNLPISQNAYKVDSLREVKTLSANEVSNLTDILYNNTRKDTSFNVESLCEFQPRNAILFFDTAGFLKEWILICFHCQDYQKSSAAIAFGEDCEEKLEKLRKLFVAKGVKFGTNRTIEKYSGETFEHF